MSEEKDPKTLTDYLAWIVLALAVAVLVVLLTRNVLAAPLPSGYYKYGRDCAQEQQQVFGLERWSSILLAQVEIESAWRPRAQSPYARGLTQFTPGTERAVAARYSLAGNIWDPSYACRLQAYLMRDLAREYGPLFRGFHAQWSAVLRCYNGSPRSFLREWALCGKPDNTVAMEPCCVRLAAHCLENMWYPVKAFKVWPKYLRAGWSK